MIIYNFFEKYRSGDGGLGPGRSKTMDVQVESEFEVSDFRTFNQPPFPPMCVRIRSLRRVRSRSDRNSSGVQRRFPDPTSNQPPLLPHRNGASVTTRGPAESSDDGDRINYTRAPGGGGEGRGAVGKVGVGRRGGPDEPAKGERARNAFTGSLFASVPEC